MVRSRDGSCPERKAPIDLVTRMESAYILQFTCHTGLNLPAEVLNLFLNI